MVSNADKVLKFETPIRKTGWMYRRSDNLHMWRKRFYELDNNILKIGEDETFKDIRVIDLAEYEVKWVNKLDKRFTICFTAKTKNQKGQYNLGDESEAVAKELYEKISLALIELRKLKEPKVKSQEDQVQSPIRAAAKNSVKRPSKIDRLFSANPDQLFSVPEDVSSWVQDVCAENQLDKDDELEKATESSESWNLLENKENVKIFQDSKNPTSFKLFATYPKLKPTELLQLVLDIDARPKWDETVESSRYLSDLPLENATSIIHRVHKPYGQIFYARESYVSRVVFHTLGKFYLLEKSLDDSEEFQKSSITLGPIKINYSATKIGSDGEQGSILMMLLSQENCSDLTPETNLNIILYSLRQFSRLETVDVEQTISTEFRANFGEFLEKFQSKSEDEEETKFDEDDDDAKIMDENEIIKETVSTRPIYRSKELSERLEDINSAKIARECVDPQVPYPTLSTEQREKKFEERSGHWLFGTDFRKDPGVGLEVLNREWIESQQKVLSHILRGMGKNLLEGKSIMSMSMPVSIFSKDTILQRAAKGVAYAPIYIQKAAEATDALEQFKLAVTFYFTMLHLGCEQQKPFNPIIGETYQGFIAGVPVIMEQVSHHPPISYLYYKTEKYTIHGTYNLEASLGANSATATQKGRIYVSLPDKNEFAATFPQANICNSVIGKRGFFWSKKMKVFDKRNGFFCEIHIYPDEKGLIGGLFSRKKDIDCTVARGKIWRIKKEYAASLWDRSHKKEAKFSEKDHVQETLASVEGSWVEYLDIDDKRYWQMKEQRPYELIDQLHKVLPSDSTCRQDLICKQMGDNAASQAWKEKLENLQREDRKLRQKFAKKK